MASVCPGWLTEAEDAAWMASVLRRSSVSRMREAGVTVCVAQRRHYLVFFNHGFMSWI